jgi:hypothetical protein
MLTIGGITTIAKRASSNASISQRRLRFLFHPGASIGAKTGASSIILYGIWFSG